ncbi:phosphotransferase enzyme family protein [Halocatena marina]|uniref:phosphotransferase enzyme family protein n=1 Tax=Halocatena marina TaxID=2934937 RepID=UPI00200CEF6D|nr:phosphotransferase [Halocatena marina]
MDRTIEHIAQQELGGPSVEIGRPPEGLHETYTLTYDDTGYIVQFLGDRDEHDDSLARGLSCYRLLADSGVPVPTPVTETVHELDGRRYTVVERLTGTTGKLDISPQRVHNAGQRLAQIHNSLDFDQPGTLSFDGLDSVVEPFCEGDWCDRIERQMRAKITILLDAGLTPARDAIAQRLDGILSVIPATFTPVLCHGDFSPDNVLFRGENVVGVLDFDRSYVGHALWDLTVSATAFWMHDPGGKWTVRDDFYDGYCSRRSITDRFERIEPLYRVATLARGVAGLINSRGLSEYEREFYTDAIIEAADRAEPV